MVYKINATESRKRNNLKEAAYFLKALKLTVIIALQKKVRKEYKGKTPSFRML